jgi:hypothetical protein
MMNAIYFANLAQTQGFTLFLAVASFLVIEFTCLHLVAKAARMKNRSYGSFYWLGLVFNPAITALIIAALPFNSNDPRSPKKDTQSHEGQPERYVNNWSAQPLVSKGEQWTLIISSAALVISLLVLASTAFGANSSQANSNSYQASNGDSSYTDTSSTSSGCTYDLTSKQIDAGYNEDDVSCLAWRWVTDKEEKNLYCDQYDWCTHAYVTAMSDCVQPNLIVKFQDSSDTEIGGDTNSGYALAAGEKELIEVGTTTLSDWSTVSVDSTSCEGTE